MGDPYVVKVGEIGEGVVLVFFGVVFAVGVGVGAGA